MEGKVKSNVCGNTKNHQVVHFETENFIVCGLNINTKLMLQKTFMAKLFIPSLCIHSLIYSLIQHIFMLRLLNVSANSVGGNSGALTTLFVWLASNLLTPADVTQAGPVRFSLPRNWDLVLALSSPHMPYCPSKMPLFPTVSPLHYNELPNLGHQTRPVSGAPQLPTPRPPCSSTGMSYTHIKLCLAHIRGCFLLSFLDRS